MVDNKKTKILATLGPETSSREIIAKLIQNGLNAVRLNFSHGTHSDHRKNIEYIKQLRDENNMPLAIVQDLQGPKIRLGNLLQEPIILKRAEKIVLCYADVQKDNKIPVSSNIFPFLKKGASILINDGHVKLRVEKIENEEAECTVVYAGAISSHKGVNLPNSILPNITLTQKDKDDLEMGIEEGVDYVAVSFVQEAQDIVQVKKFCSNRGFIPKIIAKIETAASVRNLEDIVKEADAIMVARGDLAVEVGPEEVPIVQRNSIALAKKYNKTIIIATQMLESMIENSTPTRAEVSDVATAVLDGVDAVMLSAETAIGKYPQESVAMMDRIIKRVEKYYKETHPQFSITSTQTSQNQTKAIASSAALLAYELKAKIICSLTQSGGTALSISSYRPTILVATGTDQVRVFHHLSIVWGVIPFLLEKISDNKRAYEELIATLKKIQYIADGDTAILVTGTHPGMSGFTNSIHIRIIGEKNGN